MSLEGMRKRNVGGKLDKLLKVVGKTSQGKQTTYEKEETYYPERNPEGNASAVIRFLPGLDSEDQPYYVERFQHGFQEKGWFVEFCPTTKGNPCPVCDYNREIINEYGGWDSCPKDIKGLVSARGRSKGYEAGFYSNILVLKDPMNPENEGKVFLFKFGNAILNKIMDMAQPQDDGLGAVPDAVDVFDMDEGADFKFIIRKKDKRANYDNSAFEPSSKCADFAHDDQTPLYPLIDDKLFKTNEELVKLFDRAMGKTSASTPKHNTAAGMVDSQVDGGDSAPDTGTEKPIVSDNVDDDTPPENQNMEYFNSIADDIKV